MRVFFFSLFVFVAYCALFLGGGLFVVVGVAEVMRDAERHDVQFARPGDECDGGRLKVDVEDGAPLVCTVGTPLEQPQFGRLPGFSDAQQQEVEFLIRNLGSDGLSDDEQRRIQAVVDRIAATTPPARDGIVPGPYGAQRIVVGVLMLVVLAVGSRLVHRIGPWV